MPRQVPPDRFFMNGDEWGLYDVLPAENVDHFRRVADAYHAHHRATDFTAAGWATPPYVIPPPPVAISARGIRVADLRSVLGGVMPAAAGVDSCVDYTGQPFACPDGFAFALSVDPYWQCEGFYGTRRDGTVHALHVTPTLTVGEARVPEVVDAVVRLGREFDLVLLANADHVVDLREAGEVMAFVMGA